MTKKILLIDDSLTQLEMMKMHLQSSGFDVVTTSDAYDGYKKTFSEAPDLILSDIVMPNLNGFQLCRLIKNSQSAKNIPIILLTVLDKKIDKFWGNKSGANKFISKTADYSEIEASILELIEKFPVSDEIKENLNKEIKSTSAIQTEANEIFDTLLMNSTFVSEFRELSRLLRHEEVLIEETLKLLSSFVDYDLAGLFINSPNKSDKCVLHLDLEKVPVSKFVIEKIKRDFFAQVLDDENISAKNLSQIIVREPENTEGIILNVDQFKTKFVYSFYLDDKPCGGICLYKLEELDYSKCKYYETMINELLLLLKMRYIYSETEYCSVTDGLTGLYNRRHFESNIEREFLRVRRYHSVLSLAMIDIDFFKKVNDTYGHQYGDYVLKTISEILQKSFRKTDMIYRYGGEELVIILPETTMKNSFIPLERVREKIQNYDFVYNGVHTNVTISIGIGEYNESVQSQQMLVENTDEALYKAKQTGRNKVVMVDYERIDNNTK